jgi:hypothetical protein
MDKGKPFSFSARQNQCAAYRVAAAVQLTCCIIVTPVAVFALFSLCGSKIWPGAGIIRHPVATIIAGMFFSQETKNVGNQGAETVQVSQIHQRFL